MGCFHFDNAYEIRKLSRMAVIKSGKIEFTKMDFREATKKEIETYFDVVNKVDSEIGIDSSQQRKIGRKSKEWNKKFEYELARHNIDCMRKAIKITKIDVQRCCNVLQEFSDLSIEEAQRNLSNVYRELLGKSVKKRVSNSSKYSKKYLEDYMSILNFTMNNGDETV